MSYNASMDRFLRLWLPILLATLSFSLPAKSPDEEQDCPPKFAALISRAYHSEQTLQEAVEKTFTDPLVQELELAHLRAVYDFNSNGPKTWKRFSPTWAVKDPATLEKILDHFDPHDSAASPRYAGSIHDWLKEWESGYQKDFGPIAKSWQDRDRRLFLQRLLVEGAVRYAQRMGMEKNPNLFLTQSHETAPFVNELNAGIEIAFNGSMDKFQVEFDKVWRRRNGGSVSAAQSQVPRSENRVREQLRDRGVTLEKIRGWQPRIRAAARGRQSEADIQLAVESIEAFGNTSLPLAGLLRENTEGASEHQQTKFSWEPFVQISNRHGGIAAFLKKVNQALKEKGLPEIVPKDGVKTLSGEVAVEGALFSALAMGVSSKTQFPGFQATDKDKPFYFEMDSEPAKRSGLTIREINELVRQRLP
jgi:hypothetical protein